MVSSRVARSSLRASARDLLFLRLDAKDKAGEKFTNSEEQSKAERLEGWQHALRPRTLLRSVPQGEAGVQPSGRKIHELSG